LPSWPETMRWRAVSRGWSVFSVVAVHKRQTSMEPRGLRTLPWLHWCQGGAGHLRRSPYFPRQPGWSARVRPSGLDRTPWSSSAVAASRDSPHLHRGSAGPAPAIRPTPGSGSYLRDPIVLRIQLPENAPLFLRPLGDDPTRARGRHEGCSQADEPETYEGHQHVGERHGDDGKPVAAVAPHFNARAAGDASEQHRKT
jgi:hypothetical protein